MKHRLWGLIVLLMMLTVGMLTGCQMQGVITLQHEEFHFHVGEEPDTNLATYVKASKSMMQEMGLDLSRVDYHKIGKYTGTVRYGRYMRNFVVYITDLRAPKITLKNTSFATRIGETVAIEDVVEQVTDDTDVTYGFSNDMKLADSAKKMEKAIYCAEPGEYHYEVIAKDAYNNYAVSEFVIKVTSEDEDITSGEDEGDTTIITDYTAYMNQNAGVDTSDPYVYSNADVYYGVGEERNSETNRPALDYYLNLYGQYAADFIMPDSQYVWITFNEVIERGNTAQLLDTLKEKGVSATFFITKYYAENNPDLVRRMIEEGHVLGNYTADGVDIPFLSVNDLTNQIDVLYNYVHDNFGYDMYLFRAPSGYYSEQSLAVAQSLGYRTVFWSFAYADWDLENQPAVDTALENALERLHGGAIYLFSGGSSTNTRMMEDFIDQVREKGYEFGIYQKINMGD